MFKLRLLVCLLVLGVPALYAQDKAAAPAQKAAKVELPSGESIMDKSTEATGGMDAYKKIKNMVLKGSMDLGAMGMKANMTIYKAEPNLLLAETEIPGMGKMLEGVDGKIAWGYNPIQGPSIKEGKEGDAALLEAIFDEDWKAKYTKVETLGIETVEGDECYKVSVTPKIGNVMTNYFSIKTGLLVKTESIASTAMGEIPVTILTKDYRKVGDILMPFQIVNNVAGQSMTMTFTEIKTNVDIPKSTFEPPAEVKALLGK